MVGLAAAFGAGAALVHAGVTLPTPLLLALGLLAPIGASRRPRPPSLGFAAALVLPALAAGHLHTHAWAAARADDCRLERAEGDALAVVGTVIERASPRLVLRPVRGAACGGALRVNVGRGVTPPGLGACVHATGRWRTWSATESTRGRDAGELLADSVAPSQACAPRRLLERRAHLLTRLEELFPERHGVVAALILAERGGLDPELRESFARAGTAHLLAISGFHVGVVAAIVFALVRLLVRRRRAAALLASAAVWAYVALIGAPDAAVRAALMLTFFAVGSALGRPLARSGVLGTAFLVLVAVDPGALARVGFQLSFAGAFGLTVGAPPVERVLRRSGAPRALASAVAAGVAATAATLPIVAWHFDRVSMVGIPATLVSTPLVAACIPGALAALASSPVFDGFAHFLAGGVDLLLAIFVAANRAFAWQAWSVAWVPRSWIFAGTTGAASALAAAHGLRRVGSFARAGLFTAGACAAILVLPVADGLASRDEVRLVFVDVGQGDAIALRSPGGRWILVDAGPAPLDRTGGNPAVAALRERGATRLEALVLTHPDLDHIGGAASVLRQLRVAAVLDPGRARGTASYEDVLRAARDVGAPWRAARRGDTFELDGVRVEVLHPGPPPPGGQDEESNATSVVLLLRFGGFTALLTGDAPFDVEEDASTISGPVVLLKVGHHGSETSTSDRFVERVDPEVAVVSVGRRNRYGHPDRDVVARLVTSGARLYRTDRHGTVTVVARRDGTWVARAERAAEGERRD